MAEADRQMFALPEPPAAKRPPKGGLLPHGWLRVLIVAIAAFILGSLAGAAFAPKPSEVDRLESEVDRLTARIATLEVAAAEARSANQLALAEAEQWEERYNEEADATAELVRRAERAEETLAELRAETPEPGPRRTFGDGIWRVGEEIDPGTYRASGSGDCYWARLSGFSGDLEDIIANGIGVPHPVVTISSSDTGFESSNCGTWTRV